MGMGIPQGSGRGCGKKRYGTRRAHQAAAPTTRRHCLDPEDFEVVESVDSFPIEPYLRGSWCSAETDLETEDSH